MEGLKSMKAEEIDKIQWEFLKSFWEVANKQVFNLVSKIYATADESLDFRKISTEKKRKKKQSASQAHA